MELSAAWAPVGALLLARRARSSRWIPLVAFVLLLQQLAAYQQIRSLMEAQVPVTLPGRMTDTATRLTAQVVAQLPGETVKPTMINPEDASTIRELPVKLDPPLAVPIPPPPTFTPSQTVTRPQQAFRSTLEAFEEWMIRGEALLESEIETLSKYMPRDQAVQTATRIFTYGRDIAGRFPEQTIPVEVADQNAATLKEAEKDLGAFAGGLLRATDLVAAVSIGDDGATVGSLGALDQSPLDARVDRPGTPSAATAGEHSLRIPRVSRVPRLEDFLEGVPREAEARVDDFRQREPHDGRPASRDTSAYLSYDEQNLYVVFVCKDDPAAVRAHMARREDITDDDIVTLYLDSFHDGQRAYVFSSNPFGIQRDGITTEGQGVDYRFDTIWRTEGRLTHDGFIVSMAIPFGSLRFSSDPTHRWGVAVSRTIRRSNENSYWPYITLRQAGFIVQLATLEGLEHISSTSRIQLNPYATFTDTRLLNSAIPGLTRTEDTRPGLDAKLPVGSAMALDMTLNPDFSQVESDEPQVLVNQRYEVVFPEKRPFFLENAGFFSTLVNLFFSRRIADPEFGGRLTGKAGAWAIGGLVADDRADGQRVDPSTPQYGDHALIAVGRLQRELGKESSIGVLATTRDFGAVRNQVGAIDARLRLSPTWYFAGQAAYSSDVDQQGTSRKGELFAGKLSHSGSHLAYEGTYQDWSPGFRSSVGYIRRVDLRRIEQYVGYYWRPEGSNILGFGPGVSVGGDWDHAGRLQDWWVNTDFGVDFAGPGGVRASRYDAYERYLNNGFRYARTTSSFYVSAAKWVSIDGSYTRGGAINYSPADGLDPFLAESQEASLGFTLRPKARLNLQEYYDYNTLRTIPNFLAGGEGVAKRIFDNHLMRTKINFQVTRPLSFRGIIDYYGLFPNDHLIANEKYQRLSGDFLLTYLVHPGTAVYVGYNGRLENILLDPMPTPHLQEPASRLSPTGRQLFIKVSYLFRFWPGR